MNRLKLLLVTLLMNVVLMEPTYGQQNSTSFRTLSMGYNSPVYRDFATSPLFYRGTGVFLQTSWLRKSQLRDRLLDLNFNYSSMSADAPQSSFLQPTSFASFIQLNVRYQKLWQFNRWSNDKNSLKLAGMSSTRST